MRAKARTTPVMLCLVLALTACAETDESRRNPATPPPADPAAAPDDPPASQPPAESPSPSPSPTGAATEPNGGPSIDAAAAATPGGQATGSARDTTPKRPPTISAAEFERQLARILELEQQAEFAAALRAASELRSTPLSRQDARRLGEVVDRIRHYRLQAPALRLALQRLGPDSPYQVRQVAGREILEAGEVGRLLLTAVLRDEPGPLTEPAIELLRKRRAWASAPVLLRRLSDAPDGPLAQSISDAALDLLPAVPEAEREPMGQALQSLFRTWQSLADTPASDQIAELFLFVAQDWSGREPRAFNQLLDIPEAWPWLKGYLRTAGNNEKLERQNWGLTRLVELRGEASGLVGWWTFDKLEQDRAPDLSGHGHDAQVHGARLVEGRLGRAVRLDGRDDFVRIPNSKAFQGGPGAELTVSVQFKVDKLSGRHPLVEKQWDGANGDWGLAVSGGGLSYYSESRGSQVSDYTAGGGRVEPGRWNHAVMTLRQSAERFELSMYLDGELVVRRTEDTKISASTAGHVYLGVRKYNNSRKMFAGPSVIDDLKIYRRWLDEDEIAALGPGGDLKPRPGEASLEAVRALVARWESAGDSPAQRQRIAAALREVAGNLDPEDRAAYRGPVAQLLRLETAEPDDAGETDAGAGDAWQTAVEGFAARWFDGDVAALRAWAGKNAPSVDAADDA